MPVFRIEEAEDPGPIPKARLTPGFFGGREAGGNVRVFFVTRPDGEVIPALEAPLRGPAETVVFIPGR